MMQRARLTAAKREKFVKNKKNTSKERECRFLSRVEGKMSRVEGKMSRVQKCRYRFQCGSQFSRLSRVDGKSRISVRAFPLLQHFFCTNLK